MPMLSPADIKAQKVAYELINNTKDTQEQILRNNGYKGKWLHTNATNTINNNQYIQKYLKQLQNRADKFYSNIENIADTPNIPKNNKILPTVLKANQDILDRLGHGKVQKFLSVTKKVNTLEDEKDIDGRIAKLEAKLKKS